MFFRNLKHLLAARQRFDELTKAGSDPHDAGDQIVSEAQAAGLNIETIMAIIALVQMLIELFTKK